MISHTEPTPEPSIRRQHPMHRDILPAPLTLPQRTPNMPLIHHPPPEGLRQRRKRRIPPHWHLCHGQKHAFRQVRAR